MGAALPIILGAFQVLEQLAAGLPGTITAITGIIGQVKTTLESAQAEGRDPTDAEWAAIDALVKSALSQLDANSQA